MIVRKEACANMWNMGVNKAVFLNQKNTFSHLCNPYKDILISFQIYAYYNIFTNLQGGIIVLNLALVLFS